MQIVQPAAPDSRLKCHKLTPESQYGHRYFHQTHQIMLKNTKYGHKISFIPHISEFEHDNEVRRRRRILLQRTGNSSLRRLSSYGGKF